MQLPSVLCLALNRNPNLTLTNPNRPYANIKCGCAVDLYYCIDVLNILFFTANG